MINLYSPSSFRLFFVSLFLFLLSNNEVKAQIVINEMVSSNESIISDEDGEFKDWIELYNSGAEEVDLTGMFLSDDDKKLNKWRFPQGTIPAKGFILIWASGKDKVGADGQLHTNFNISVDGEEVILTNNDGSIIDSIRVPALEKDISYARIPDGQTWTISSKPTPGQSNQYIEKIQPPAFSSLGGFYKESFNLSLSSQNVDAIILYTIDGSDPTLENIEGKIYQYKNKYKEFPITGDGKLVTDTIRSYQYTTPIQIEDRTAEKSGVFKISTTYNFNTDYIPSNTRDVLKGTVVKSRVYKEGIGYSDVITQTYFVNSIGRDLYDLPVISLSTSKENLFDYNKGIYVAGKDFDDWRNENPFAVANPSVNANYQRRGDENEYPIQLEYFDSNQDSSIINQQVGFRIHGGWSRADGQKGLRLYARSDYGESKLKHNFFKNLEEDKFKRLILKNTSIFRIQDAICQKLISHLNFGSQASQFVNVFINGEFWGLQEIKERLDKNYLEAKYNIDPENIDYLTNNMEVGEGDSLHYKTMIDFVLSNSLESSTNYEVVKNQIDIENFTDFQIAQIYVNNKDWPHNNVDYWRVRTDVIDENAPYGHDGKWRWLIYDMDLSLNGIATEDSSAHNTLEWATRDHNSTVLLRNLVTNKDFSNQFVNRFSDLMNTTFLPERLEPLIEEDRAYYNAIFPEHITRWKYVSGGLTRLNNMMNRMISYVHTRPEPMRQHLQSKFNLKGSVSIELSTNDISAPNYIRINTIDITENTVGVFANPYPWTGIYFDGIPVEITAIAAPGYEFEYWEGMPVGTPANFVKNFDKDVQLVAHFKIIDSLQINLTYTSSIEGYLEGDSLQTIIKYSNGKSVLAIPNEGYAFQSWSDGKLNNPRVDSNVVSDITVEAIFKNNQVKLTYTSSIGGYLEGDSLQTIIKNSNGTSILAVANEGYAFQSWSDGKLNNPRIDSNVVLDVNVEAIFSIATSIQENNSFNLKIYPNPVSQFLHIETNQNEALSYQIMHSNGQVVKGNILNGNSAIDVSDLPSSIYLLLIYDKIGNTSIQKFIKN